MLEGKALVQDSDMPWKMQVKATAAASEALDLYNVFDCRSIAAHIKMVTPFFIRSSKFLHGRCISEFGVRFLIRCMTMCGGIKLWVFLHTLQRQLHLLYSGNSQLSHLQRRCSCFLISSSFTLVHQRTIHVAFKSCKKKLWILWWVVGFSSLFQLSFNNSEIWRVCVQTWLKKLTSALCNVPMWQRGC